MGLDVNKLMKKAADDLAQKKPELFDNKKDVAASQSNLSVKNDTIQDKAKTDAYIKNSVWNTKYQPVIDKAGFDGAINYSNSLHMMKAVNGRYDNILNSNDVSDEAKQTIKTLKNSSIAAMDEMVKLTTGKGDVKLFEKYRGNADKAEAVLKEQLGPKAGKNYVYDPDKKIITDKITFKKNHQGVNKETREEGYDRYTTTTGVGSGGSNPMAAYLQMKDYTERSMAQVRSQTNPLVSAWTNNAINLLNSDDKAAGRIDPDNRTKTLAYAKDVLTFASKYGTQTGKKGYDDEIKVKAAKLLKGLNNKDLDFAETLDYLKKNTNGKTNFITDIVKDLGYYGSNYLYKRHKATFNNDKYYQGAEKYWGKTDLIDQEITNHETYVKNTKEDKKQAKIEARIEYGEIVEEPTDYTPMVSETGDFLYNLFDKVGLVSKADDKKRAQYVSSVKKDTFNAAISDDGEIRSYEQFIKNLGPEYKIQSGLAGDRKIQTKQDYRDVVYNATKGFWDPKTNTLFYEDDDFNKVMRKNYNEIVKTYKRRFSKLNDPKKRETDMGSGDTADLVLSHEYVNMELDKNNNMIHSGDYKGSNVNTIFNMMKTSENGINKQDVTLIPHNKIIMWSKASKEKLNELKASNEETFNNFFKDKDLSEMKMVFDRHSSIPYHATYTFINQKTGKKLAMVAPANYIEKNNETFWKNTTMTVPEARFLKAGSVSLPDKDGYYKNAAIIQKDGIKVAVYKYLDTDGVTKQEEIPIGDVQIEVAQQQFKEYFDRLIAIEKVYNKK